MQENIPERLAKAVRAERGRQGLTQEELALAAGVSYRTVIQIEQGKLTSRLDVIAQVLGALGLTLDVRPAARSLSRETAAPKTADRAALRFPRSRSNL